MGNFREKVSRFMYGRYGQDHLYYVGLILILILIIINSFVRNSIISALTWVVLILITFRVFSKNVYKRRSENEKFLKLWNPIKAKLMLQIRRFKERKTHCFRKCPSCKKVLRLPRKKGKHVVNCPCCHKDFSIKVW